ncbi:MAG: hypothetical protein SVX43_15455 [Cyanobacteriota bacterium]|nr:hypothetical protein [Cyanobacteriota bacterium]
MMPRIRKVLLSVFLASLLLLTATACTTSAPPSRFEQAQQESTQRGAEAVPDEAVAGGKFNRFFPQSQGEYQVVYSQEKQGFAEARLKQNGQVMAMLAISDISGNPSAADKFQGSSQKIGGYPAVNPGSTATAVLVDNRFQVKVLSRNSAFAPGDRQTWLEKFDLAGLAGL